MGKVAHFLYMPLLGLGLYGGHRGNRWLKNRIKIFKQFVLPSILAQTDRDFILWVSVRPEDMHDPIILEFKFFFQAYTNLRVVFTYSGICFWDDKYPDDVAHTRLARAIHGAMGSLINQIDDADTVLMTIQPSDDCYHSNMVRDTKKAFAADPTLQAFGYRKGYVMDYTKLKLAEWNPKTTPPFYTIKFSRENFIDPLKHMRYTGAYKSHEYVKDFLKENYSDYRGFVVGTHGENISTIFNHPFTGAPVETTALKDFGLESVEPLKIKISLRKILMRKLPHGWQRKLRYWCGERFYHKLYEFLRS